MLTKSQKEDVFKFIGTLKNSSFVFRDLVRFLNLDSDERRSLQHYLDELDSEGIVHRVRRGRYALPSKESLLQGVLTCHRDGYGFIAPDEGSIYGEDIFVPARNMGEALHGDRVLAKVQRKRRPPPRGPGRRRAAEAPEERLEGTIVRVLQRKHPSIVGRYYAHPRFPFVVPLDPRIIYDIRIPFHQAHNAGNGQIVVVDIITPPGRYQSPEGRVREILGEPGDPEIEYEIVRHKFGLPLDFSAEALAEAAGIAERVSEMDLQGREDFRTETIVTIDGETARDFDDAVCLRRLENGHYLLGILIADVSHYVPENSALDRDAYARGTSVYFPDRAIPMLPPRLSSGICSLKPAEDRLVFSVWMEIDSRGEVVRRRFAEGIVRSCARMTYTAVAKILVQRDPDECARHAGLVPMFEQMEELCLILSRKRRLRGSVDFDLPEAEMEFDENGRVIAVMASEHNIAHRIIEEFMLLANECVAHQLAQSGGPGLYRVHEKPDPRKVDDFAEFALALGYRLESRDGEYRPRDFQRLVEQLEGKLEGRFLAYLMLRSFMQARYSEINRAHFGLATDEYTHFTSPIRRYPDLVVHRLLRQSLRKKPDAAWQERMAEELPEIARHTSARERNADEAEREIEKIKKVQFMAEKLGDEFDAVIFSVIRQGFFVELLDHFVEGFVPAGTLIDDQYQYKEKTHTFLGTQRRRRFELGSRIRVRLDSADQESFRLTFSVV